jgi:hypothetical protein
MWFEPNLGQAPDGVSFFARAPGYTLGIDSEGAGLHLLSAASTNVSLNFLSPLSPLGGEGSGVRGSEGQGLLPGVSNYANNANPITGVPHFSRVVVHDLYPNIDVV